MLELITHYITEAAEIVQPLCVKVETCINDCFSRRKPIEIIVISCIAFLFLQYIWDFVCHLDDNLHRMKLKFFRMARKAPFLREMIAKKLSDAEHDVTMSVKKFDKGSTYVERLPSKPLTKKEVAEKLNSYGKMGSIQWKDGFVSGAVYGATQDLSELVTEVFRMHAFSNPLHADVFPDIRKMEAEIVRMVCNMFNGDETTCGCTTSGGTESLMLACKAYRDRAIENGIRAPEMVLPVTAHCAFDKAAQYFTIKMRKIPIDPVTKQVNLRAMRSAINKNTCMLVGSAPNYPYGVIDPIEKIAALGLRYGVPVHVDSCLGGFLLPFLEKAGFKPPPFDFRVEGVTSISCDTHKYGYVPKGSSVLMYRNKEYRRFQYFAAVDWPGGVYASATFAGSRPGSLIAACWATMMYLGEPGYVNATREIVNTARKMAAGLAKIKHLYLIPDNQEHIYNVVTVGSHDFNIYRLSDTLNTKGWALNPLQFPACIHICLTNLHALKGVAEKFIQDVQICVDEIMKTPNASLGSTAVMYGAATTVPDRSIVSDIAFAYLDACLDSKQMKEQK